MKTEINYGFREVVAILLTLVFSCVAVAGQNTETRILGTAASGDVFQISQGKSLSASISTNRRPSTLAPVILLGDVEEALRLINLNYVDAKRLSLDTLIKSGSNGMLRSLDPHSKFFGESEFRELLGEHENKYAGIGVTLQTFEQSGKIQTFVIATAESSPAERAGLAFGDRIIAVDGESADGHDSDEVRELFRGRVGTAVMLTIERNASGVIEMLHLRRENIPIRTVKDAFMISDGVGYLDLTVGFGYSTPGEVSAAIKKLSAEGMDSLIIDLRSNRGGLVDSAVEVAESFLPRGAAILSEKGRYPASNHSYFSENSNPISVPIVLLANGQTASAAEILAGALQDNDRALVIGEPTYGKGLVQEVIGFENGAGMALTAARYYTPSGRSIQREYTDAHLYDYFRYAGRGAAIDKPVLAARTLTNRIVYGGSGITPDVQVRSSKEDSIGGRNLNDAFAIARKLAAEISYNAKSPQKPAIPQCSANRDGAEPLSRVASSLRSIVFSQTELQRVSREAQQEVAWQAQQFLIYSLCGRKAVDRLRLALDPVVLEGINAIPAAAELMRKAQRVRRKTK